MSLLGLVSGLCWVGVLAGKKLANESNLSPPLWAGLLPMPPQGIHIDVALLGRRLRLWFREWVKAHIRLYL